jgi:hypothetical protein
MTKARFTEEVQIFKSVQEIGELVGKAVTAIAIEQNGTVYLKFKGGKVIQFSRGIGSSVKLGTIEVEPE